MDGIREYLLSVICAAVVCTVVTTLVNKKSACGAILQLVAGIYMALVLISPLLTIKLTDYTEYFKSFSADASSAVTFGETIAQEELQSIIKSQTEAYILDKAESMDVVVDVEVTLSIDSPPIPCGVRITGAISPYSKEILSRYMANELGISKEDQVWI